MLLSFRPINKNKYSNRKSMIIQPRKILNCVKPSYIFPASILAKIRVLQRQLSFAINTKYTITSSSLFLFESETCLYDKAPPRVNFLGFFSGVRPFQTYPLLEQPLEKLSQRINHKIYKINFPCFEKFIESKTKKV